MTPRGTHLLLECRGCRPDVLNDAAALEEALRGAAAAIQAQVLSATFHAFAPQGVTGVLLLSESHLSIHTWPEHRYAAIDLFTCGLTGPEAALPILRAALNASEVECVTVKRGLHA